MTLTRTRAIEGVINEKDVTRVGKAGRYEYVRHAGKLWRIGERADDPSSYFPRPSRRFLMAREERVIDGYKEAMSVAFQLDLVADNAYDKARAADEQKAAAAAKKLEAERPRPANVFRRWPILNGKKGRPLPIAAEPIEMPLGPVSKDEADYLTERLKNRRGESRVARVFTADVPPVETIADLDAWAAEQHVTLKVVNDRLQRLWRSGRINREVSEILDKFEEELVDYRLGVERPCLFTADCEGTMDRMADGYLEWCGRCDGVHPYKSRVAA